MPFFERLVDEFYAGVATDDVLLPLYPEQPDLTGARHRLTLFLAQYWGGPTTYSDERGHPRLRMRHFPYLVGPVQRDRWLHHMGAAVAAVCDDPSIARDRRGADDLLRHGRRAPAQRHRSAHHVGLVRQRPVAFPTPWRSFESTSCASSTATTWAVDDLSFAVAAGRGVRTARGERGGQVDHRRDPRGPSRGRRPDRCRCSVAIRGTPVVNFAIASASCCSRRASRPSSPCAR